MVPRGLTCRGGLQSDGAVGQIIMSQSREGVPYYITRKIDCATEHT
jgi:hypothetical protein